MILGFLFSFPNSLGGTSANTFSEDTNFTNAWSLCSHSKGTWQKNITNTHRVCMDKPVSLGVLISVLLSAKPQANTTTLALPPQGGGEIWLNSSALKWRCASLWLQLILVRRELHLSWFSSRSCYLSGNYTMNCPSWGHRRDGQWPRTCAADPFIPPLPPLEETASSR